MEKDVRRWAEDAKAKLEQAQTIGASASLRLERAKLKITRNNENLIKGNFMLDSINQQLQLLETIYESIELNIEEKVQSVDILSNYLNNTIEELETEFDELKSIKVDSAFNSKQDNLYQFVSNEVLDDLMMEFDNVDDYFKDLISGLEKSLKVMRVRLNEFNESYDLLDKEITSITNAAWITTLIDETNNLEVELATLIESITNHYDQCVKGLNIIEGNPIGEITEEQEKLELFDVLAKDFEEVPEVISDIEEVFEDIETRCRRIEEFLEKRDFNKKLNELYLKLNEFGERLTSTVTDLSKKTSSFHSKIKDINEKCDESNELIRHYQKFSKSYYSLILEINRRKSVQEKMQRLIAETNTKVKSLQEEDFRFRNSFMSNNGSFLPNDLWAGFNDESPLVQIDLQYADLPNIGGSTLSLAKDALSSMRS